MDLSADFGPFDGRAWLNCAHQGPLPRVAVEAAGRALADKTAPHRLADELFTEVPARLKDAIGRLLGVPVDQVVLGNSTSYGLQLIVHGYPWKEGDEVLLVDGDFPATVVPWLPLEGRGVRVRLLDPASVLDAERLDAEIGPATRLLCTSWVFSFSGRALDLEALGRLCRERGVAFVVNGAQGVGSAQLDLAATPVDALVSCGFKWLCGPYGTGFCWLRPELLDRLVDPPAYWLAHQTQDDLRRGIGYSLRDDLGAAAYDVFGTPNFLTFMPWTAALEYMLGVGVERVAARDQSLVDRLIAGLGDDWRLISPRRAAERSTLVVISQREPERNAGLFERLTSAGVDVAMRNGNLRVSPHLHNTEADIDRALDVLTSAQPRRSRRA